MNTDEKASPARESVRRCLYCNGQPDSNGIGAVQDWFFHALPGEFDFSRCNDCGSLWLAERPAGEALGRAYAAYYTHDEADPSTRGGLRDRLRSTYLRAQYGASASLAARAMAALYRMAAPNLAETHAQCRFAPRAPARIMDYGCGSGAYLRQMRDLGFDVTGVEIDPVTLARLRALNLPAFTPQEAVQQDWQSAFDHITLAHVIEHVTQPAALLRQVHNWLRPGGACFVEVPHARASGLEIFGKYWRGLEAPRHFSLPTLPALISAARQAGFAVEQQVIRRSVRNWLWADSARAAAQDGHRISPDNSPAETSDNAEFLTLLLRKPS